MNAFRALALPLVVALCLAAMPSSSMAAGVSLCALGPDPVPDWCLPPSKVRIAEARMPVTAVDPVKVVWKAARLRLTEVELRLPKHPLEISYRFGTIPRTNLGGGGAALASHKSHYVIVGELVGSIPDKHPSIFKDDPGYWDWDANFRCRHLTLQVLSNEPKGVVQRIGNGVLQVEPCGK